MGPYTLAINAGTAVSADSLNVAPVRMAVGNLVAGALELRWTYCGDPDGAVEACPIAEGDRVRLYNAGVMLFDGVAMTPSISVRESGNLYVIRVMDAFWRWSRRLFIRGTWWPSQRYPYGYTPGGVIPAPDWSNFTNSPVCELYRGYRWVMTTSGGHSWDVKTLETQTIAKAVQEAVYLAQTLEERDGLTTVALGSVDFGADGLTPEAAWQGPTDILAWLVKSMQPQIDGWARVRAVDGVMTFEAGRYRDQAAAEVSLKTWGLEDTGTNVQGMISAQYDAETQAVVTGVIWPGGWGADIDTDGDTLRWGDDGVVPVLYNAPPTAWYLGSGYDPIGLSQLVGESLLLPRWRGSAVVDAADWGSVQPGGRLRVGGRDLNIQRATLDFDREQVAVQCGMPEALGLSDMSGLGAWVAANFRSLKSQIVP